MDLRILWGIRCLNDVEPAHKILVPITSKQKRAATQWCYRSKFWPEPLSSSIICVSGETE